MERIELRWTGEGHAFDAERDGMVTRIDGDAGSGPSPVTLLLEAVAACAAIDVVDILRKGRQPVEALRLRAGGLRRDDPPRYFTHLQFEFEIDGAVDPRKAERAVKLSFDTYCSVYNSLRPDIDLSWSVDVRDAAARPGPSR